MGKPAVILLIVMVELGILFAGQAQMQSATEEITASVDMFAPVAAPGSLHDGHPGESRLPKARDITIDLLYDYTPQIYLTRSHRYIRQILSVSREGPGVKIEEGGGCEITRPGGQLVEAAAASPPASLASLCTGLILRL